MPAPLRALLFIACLWSRAFSLQVSPNSTCASLCLDDPDGNPLDPAASTTKYTDIVCSDADYGSTTEGFKYQNCINCLQNSTAISGTESDIHWFLYNLRYAVDVCLFGFPDSTQNVSSPCDIDYACAPLKGALESGNLDSNNDAQYGYCSADGGSFSNGTIEACVQCLQASTEEVYTSNCEMNSSPQHVELSILTRAVLIALQAGCDQQPKAGQLLGLGGTLFTDKAVNVTTPPAASGTTASGSNKSTSSMTTGAIVGIAIGAGLLLLGGLGLFCAYHRKQKKLYRLEPKSDCHSRRGSSHITPPMSGGMGLGLGYSSVDHKNLTSMSDYELRAQMSYGDTNADYYDKLEQEMQMRKVPRYTLDPNRPGSGPASALPAHQAYNPQTTSRNSPRHLAPTPPAPVKSNAPDSYALQAYLNAAEDSATIVLPPPPTPQRPSSSNSRRTQTRTPSPNSDTGSIHPPPPPKGSPPSKVPALTLPSVPRIRVPKKYSPPSIQIQEATPIAGRGEVEFGLNISGPIERDDVRFRDPSMGPTPEPSSGGSGRSSRSEAPLMGGRRSPPIEQTAIDLRRGLELAETPLRSGKSSLY